MKMENKEENEKKISKSKMKKEIRIGLVIYKQRLKLTLLNRS
jgi:hypothetical protein